jgi:hypothetical protein
MKQHKRHASRAVLAPHNRKRTALPVSYVHSVDGVQWGMLTRVASNATRGISQTLEGRPPAKAALMARIKKQLASLTALAVSLGVILTVAM